MSSFKKRSKQRKAHHLRSIKGTKQRPCVICIGLGVSDRDSTNCGACKGTGKEYYNPEFFKN